MKINIDLIYPIGAIYISTNTINPSTLFGGEWRQIKDRFLLACGDAYDIGKQGGEATHKLTIEELPSHAHSLPYRVGGGGGSTWYTDPGTAEGHSSSQATAVGGNQAHNNMPPYLAVCVWERIG